MLNIDYTTTFTAADFLTTADRIERLTPGKAHPRLVEKRRLVASRLREMATAPTTPEHAEYLMRLTVIDYSAWTARSV